MSQAPGNLPFPEVQFLSFPHLPMSSFSYLPSWWVGTIAYFLETELPQFSFVGVDGHGLFTSWLWYLKSPSKRYRVMELTWALRKGNIFLSCSFIFIWRVSPNCGAGRLAVIPSLQECLLFPDGLQLPPHQILGGWQSGSTIFEVPVALSYLFSWFGVMYFPLFLPTFVLKEQIFKFKILKINF